MRVMLIIGLLGVLRSHAAAQSPWGEAIHTIDLEQATIPAASYDYMRHKHQQETERTADAERTSVGRVEVSICAGPRPSLSKGMIRRRIRAQRARLRYCYDKHLKREPNLAGTATTDFVVNEQGSVIRISASGSGAPSLDACVKSVVRGLRFPSLKGGGDTRVTYPFAFRRSNEAGG